jgi:hypothetical protein
VYAAVCCLIYAYYDFLRLDCEITESQKVMSSLVMERLDKNLAHAQTIASFC